LSDVRRAARIAAGAGATFLHYSGASNFHGSLAAESIVALSVFAVVSRLALVTFDGLAKANANSENNSEQNKKFHFFNRIIRIDQRKIKI